MNRRSIPAYEMIRAGQESLRQEGFVVTSVLGSLRDDPRRLQPHYHDFFQMMWMQGRARVMHDFYEVHTGGTTLFFFSPGQVHAVHPRPGCDGFTVSFSQGFFDHRASPPSMLFELPFFFPVGEPPWLKIPEGDEFQIGTAFAELSREFEAAKAGVAEALRAWLRILFIRIGRLYQVQRPQAQPSRQSLLVRRFHLAVEGGFREERALTHYARELGVTANHLNDVVRAETGRAAGDIVRKRRLLDAQRLLLHSDLSVAEIGYQTGFADPSYFGRFFRRETHLTPAAFREKIREKYHS